VREEIERNTPNKRSGAIFFFSIEKLLPRDLIMSPTIGMARRYRKNSTELGDMPSS
jgi:hypothetical protein